MAPPPKPDVVSGTAHALARLRATLDEPGRSEGERLSRARRLMLRSDIAALAARLFAGRAAVVQSGPFAGMAFPPRVAEGCTLPKLLGCYEQELHRIIARTPRRGYARVVNIGCAEGYYAVGLARLLPEVRVVAFDPSAAARRLCDRLARLNGVRDRLAIGAAATVATLAQAIAGPTLVVCDCEGCEYAVLDPEAVPALARADLIVELHGTRADPGRARAFLARFRPTHRLQVIRQAPRDPATIPAIAALSQLEQFLASWEFRSEPTPWVVMQARRREG
jgi:SAM-dependent methyltransferase